MKQITRQRNAQLVADYQAGMSLTKLAEKYEIGRFYVQDICRNAFPGVRVCEWINKPESVPSEGKKSKYQQKREVLVLEYLAGATLDELAEQHGCTKQNVSLILRGAGVIPSEVNKVRQAIKGPREKPQKPITEMQQTRLKNQAAKEIGLRWCSACQEFKRIEDEFSSGQSVCKACKAQRTKDFSKTEAGKAYRRAYWAKNKERCCEIMRRYQAKRKQREATP